MAEGAFAVKRIVAVRLTKDGTKEFRVQWRASWEPEDNLKHCQQALDDFYRDIASNDPLPPPPKKRKRLRRLIEDNDA